MDRTVAYIFVSVCQVLKDAHERELVPSFCMTVQTSNQCVRLTGKWRSMKEQTHEAQTLLLARRQHIIPACTAYRCAASHTISYHIISGISSAPITNRT